MTPRVVDVWMQHPNRAFLADPVFESLRRWSHRSLPEGELPLDATLGAMDAAGLGGLGLDDETVELFLHGNAERVFELT